MIAAILPVPSATIGFSAFIALKLLVKELIEIDAACALTLASAVPLTAAMPTLAASAQETIPTLLLRSKLTRYLLWPLSGRGRQTDTGPPPFTGNHVMEA